MNLLHEIEQEIARLEKARSLLLEEPVKRGPGRPKGSGKSGTAVKVRTGRTLSDEGRERIAAAQKKRWAARRGEENNDAS